MYLALALCLAASVPAETGNLDNLDFHHGTLAGWEGEGFAPAPAGRHGPSAGFAVCSSDRGPKGHKAMLHRTITIPPGAGARYRQDLPYATPAWQARYATLRNTIEGLNGYAKDPAHEALAQPGRRRIRGIAACSLFTALLLIAANIRKIRAWRALTASGKAAAAQRARRRRTSLRDHLPDR